MVPQWDPLSPNLNTESFLTWHHELLERAVFSHNCHFLTWVSLFNSFQCCFHSQYTSVTAPSKVNMTPVSFTPTDTCSPHPGCTLSSIWHHGLSSSFRPRLPHTVSPGFLPTLLILSDGFLYSFAGSSSSAGVSHGLFSCCFPILTQYSIQVFIHAHNFSCPLQTGDFQKYTPILEPSSELQTDTFNFLLNISS